MVDNSPAMDNSRKTGDPDGGAAAGRDVLRLSALEQGSANRSLRRLLARCGLELEPVADGQPIPGSYWGEEEAGLRGARLHARGDTPVHSVLHEACHYLCVDPRRRATLDTDAGGDVEEENAVCYLQILLAEDIDGCDADRMLADMDAWGYSFRLGSARRWFEEDAAEPRRWLCARGLIDRGGRWTGRRRGDR
jgi:hypothetical protein